MILAAALLAAALSVQALANGPRLVSNAPSPHIPVAALWQGATAYGMGKPVKAYFVHSIADWGNELYFMDPATEGEVPLMKYRSTGKAFQCPDSGGLAWDLGVRDSSQEIVFMLRTISAEYGGKYCTGEACGPRYTGMNDPIRSRFHSRGQFAHLAGFVWSQSARITAAQSDSLPAVCNGGPRPAPGEGGVLFSFNDGANDTFGDLVFLVTGVEMDVERFGAPSVTPDTAIVQAAPAECRISALAGGVTEGETFRPRPIALPVSAILPRANPGQVRVFMDQHWRLEDPARPDETQFPNGPDIRVTTPGPFEFNLGFFTNQGGFVNRARGTVSSEMLENIPPGPDGRRAISLMWYPASSDGYLASTGAYVVKGWLRTLPPHDPPLPQERPAHCPERKTNLLSSFGYIRH